MKPATCAECAHFKISPDVAKQAAAANLRAEAFGLCHRFPPVPVLAMTQQGGQIVPARPPVAQTDSCGEFRLMLPTLNGR